MATGRDEGTDTEGETDGEGDSQRPRVSSRDAKTPQEPGPSQAAHGTKSVGPGTDAGQYISAPLEVRQPMLIPL